MPTFSAVKRQAYLDALRSGAWRTAAAEAAGVHFSTVRRHMLADPDFAAAVGEAELDANTAVENALYRRALEGHVVAALAWLYSRAPDRWRDMRSPGMAGQADLQPPIRELSPDQQAKLLTVVRALREDQ